jgi:flagellar hook protein FlgE
MIRSLYAGVSGMRNHQIRMDVVGNNIANANTTGFKAGRVNFQDLFSQQVRFASGTEEPPYRYPSQAGTGVTVGSIQNLFDQGGFQATGRILDVAIEGNGFFMLKDPGEEGLIYYTRNGNFTLDKEGYLVNLEGYRVLDEGGAEITAVDIEAGQQIVSIDKNGTITVLSPDGTVDTLGVIGLANIINPESMEKDGSNNYRPTIATQGFSDFSTPINPGSPGGEGGQGKLEAGYLEMSNVDLTNEFANLITTQRGYQANARVITTSDEMMRDIIDLKR